MRIVLDTNVFISGIFFTGPPSQIIKAFEEIRSKLKKHEFSNFRNLGQSFTVEDWPNKAIQPTA